MGYLRQIFDMLVSKFIVTPRFLITDELRDPRPYLLLGITLAVAEIRGFLYLALRNYQPSSFVGSYLKFII